MKSQRIMIIVASIVALLSIGGCTLKHKDDTKHGKTIASSSIKEDKKAIKQKQFAFLKEHEQEIVDFVKAQNLKVESVKNIGMKLSGAWQEMEHLKVVTK